MIQIVTLTLFLEAVKVAEAERAVSSDWIAQVFDSYSVDQTGSRFWDPNSSDSKDGLDSTDPTNSTTMEIKCLEFPSIHWVQNPHGQRLD
jgi:hypothetical protein